ncbi:hypothetical protein [Calothrix sp. 336/3]|uniref:hypothetical protein n=1 Tax=Calothrix sp. 336/3 TaxID=1337936 RepID=UPI0004E39F5D|nr:hypothetical protein [Calothrix sp. 336/3]AKG23299.1 hypothetical protein IJ00_20250 [Calothrix sp. 336/3]
MALFRLILLIALLGGLTLLLAQNWSPVLPLVFFGVRTKSLPLAIWILFATSAGVITSLVITSLFPIANSLAGEKRPTSSRKSTFKETTTQRPSKEEKPPRAPTPSPEKATSSRDNDGDWEDIDRPQDWDFDEERETPPPSAKTQVQDGKSYERQQDVKSKSQSGSVYSYSYREPKNSGVGKTESVFDADYRVIIPPYQPPDENQAEDLVNDDNDGNNDDDDWGIFSEDDEDFDDSENRNKRPRR